MFISVNYSFKIEKVFDTYYADFYDLGRVTQLHETVQHHNPKNTNIFSSHYNNSSPPYI